MVPVLEPDLPTARFRQPEAALFRHIITTSLSYDQLRFGHLFLYVYPKKKNRKSQTSSLALKV